MEFWSFTLCFFCHLIHFFLVTFDAVNYFWPVGSVIGCDFLLALRAVSLPEFIGAAADNAVAMPAVEAFARNRQGHFAVKLKFPSDQFVIPSALYASKYFV